MALNADTVLFHIQPASYFGWGVYAINLMLYWPGKALATRRPGPIVSPNEAVAQRLQALLHDCRDVIARAESDAVCEFPLPLIATFGNGGLDVATPISGRLRGSPTVPLACFEQTDLAERLRSLHEFPVVLATSNWVRDRLQAAGVVRAKTVYQGVDADLFRPGKRDDDGTFRIFSGGKLEYRKGQDIVLAAFRVFQQRRPSARLEVAWHSPWQELARDMHVFGRTAPVPFTAQGYIDVPGWVAANGIDPAAVTPLVFVPNAQLPERLRNCDVALFPSRAEGAINNMAMEAIACGVPTVVSHNTGHRELVALAGCEALRSQGEIGGPGCAGWGESSVEELVETLDAIYLDREGARRRAAAARQAIAALHWPRALTAFKSAIECAGLGGEGEAAAPVSATGGAAPHGA